MSAFSTRISSTSTRKTPPDPATARANEAAVLAEIDAHLSPESRAAIMPILRGDRRDGYTYLIKGKTDEWNDRYARYYAARAHRVDEERRDSSVTAAYKRGGIPVEVVLGDLPSGSVASVLRRTEKQPPTVIILNAAATGTTLGGAFAALDQSRKLEGDDLTMDVMIAITDTHATSVDADYQTRLEQLVERLKNAPMKSIDGLGSVRAIKLRSLKLKAAGNHP